MGDPRRQKKKYVTPKRPFDSDRFEQELNLIGTYGLRNKKELWKHKTDLSRYRRQARNLLALSLDERALQEKELVDKLVRTGVLATEPSLDHILDLTLENILDRRLQTLIFKKGLACSVHHSRQLVTHGHIALDGARVTTPRRIMNVDEEERLLFTPKSALNSESHPARVAASDAALRALQPPEEVDESDDRFRGRRDGRRRQGGGKRR